jgi:hypothetical protein
MIQNCLGDVKGLYVTITIIMRGFNYEKVEIMQ